MESICPLASMVEKRMNDNATQSIRESYDRVADEYALRIFHELQHKALDRELLNRFAGEIKGRGVACDMGCGPGSGSPLPPGRGHNCFWARCFSPNDRTSSTTQP